MLDSLWGEEFNISKVDDSELLKKTTQKTLKNKKVSINEKLSLIDTEVNKVLGKQKSNVIVITTKEDFVDYVNKCINIGKIAIDTETNNSLDPSTCKIMGLCLYSEGLKQAYIPINHRDCITKERLTNQLTEIDLKNELQRLKDNKTFMIFHNGKFDYQVIKCTCDIELNIDWDTMIAAKVLDENEKAGLKSQYTTKIDLEQEKYAIDDLFNNVEYADVDPCVFSLYAATDSMMTYKLYQYQMNLFNLKENKKLLEFYNAVELPCIIPVAEMELNGMEIDQEYAKRLSKKYNNKLIELDKELDIELNKLQDKINSWRLSSDANFKKETKDKKGNIKYQKSKSEQLESPINLASPTQLAILFYDILQCPTVNKKSVRGTGESDLKEINNILNLKLIDLIIERRGLVKLISTYVDVIPQLATNWKDGRIRTHFNQYGADTGRFSSGGKSQFGPGVNFQNIPSKNKEIRLLFKAKDGYRICGGDYSAQEPRLTSQYAQDENMINAYKEGKDLYSVIAAMSFNRKYEDCLEFYPEGTEIIFEGKKVICGNKTHTNKEGKQYRTYAKSILLGLLYGRGSKSIGEQLGKTKEEAQEIIDKFFNKFPKVKKWIDESIKNAHELGYVEDISGRRRRLPDIQLPLYDISFINKTKNKGVLFNPFLNCENRLDTKSLKLINDYKEKLQKCKWGTQINKIKEEAYKDGLYIVDNNNLIAQAERQAVNARVQGGAATLTKLAMIQIHNDERLRKINAKLVSTVHDEILIEAPVEYSELAEKYLSEDMIVAAKKYVPDVPMKCDTYNVSHWYLDEMQTNIENEFKKLLDKNNFENAFNIISQNHEELTNELLYDWLKGYKS